MEPLALGLSITDTGKAMAGPEKPLSRATIYRMIGRGELEAVKIGSRTIVTTESIRKRVADAPRLKAVA